jgi:hypothetical protein
MHGIYSRVLLFAWALWLGGLVSLLLAVTTIFAALDPDRHAAGNIAAQVFGKSDRPMLVIAAAALLAALGLALPKKTLARTATISLLALAALAAVVEVGLISPRINQMRALQQTDTPDFKSLHGTSMVIYLGMGTALAAAGLFIPRAIRRDLP